MNILHELFPLLTCPDDGGELRLLAGSLQCIGCDRHYPILAGNMVELLPRQALPPAGSVSYAKTYIADAAAPFDWRPDRLAWGSPEAFPPEWVERKHRQVAAVRRLLDEDAGPKSLLCDFSAGAGYYTFAYAKDWRWVMHCDLSVDGLNYAHRKAAKLGITNILFVRMDYLRPAFRRNLHRVICFDTLIRGEAHERLLLHSIRNSLAPGGGAIVDFHNWWHNPLRRLGLLRNNFGANRSYGKRELGRLLSAAGIADSNCVPFYQESSLLRHILPPTRWMYRFNGEASHATR